VSEAINRLDPLELLRLENRELRALLHASQGRIQEMQQVAAQHVVLTHFVAALATAAGGSMVITYEQVQAAQEHNAFRFMVDRGEREDGKVDARVTVYPLTDEERAAQQKAAADAAALPVDKASRLILPE
jgi:hypothetical protein